MNFLVTLQVKLIVSLKGRENEFKNNAIELIRRFRDDVGELAVEESKNLKDRNMTLVLVPNKAVIQKEAPKEERKDNRNRDPSIRKRMSHPVADPGFFFQGVHFFKCSSFLCPKIK
ncbi:putative translation initiation factor 3 [Helianthus annuus]|nr:putative translation initiation factor 3 [Helianthus annuus]